MRALKGWIRNQIGAGECNARGAGAFEQSHDVLSQQVDRCRQENDILHQERKLPAITGKPAIGSQPFGMNGMIVILVDPMAPKIPSGLLQNPRNSSAPNSHSETPRSQEAPRWLALSFD
jgi:hypothetical protein